MTRRKEKELGEIRGQGRKVCWDSSYHKRKLTHVLYPGTAQGRRSRVTGATRNLSQGGEIPLAPAYHQGLLAPAHHQGLARACSLSHMKLTGRHGNDEARHQHQGSAPPFRFTFAPDRPFDSLFDPSPLFIPRFCPWHPPPPFPALFQFVPLIHSPGFSPSFPSLPRW